VSAAGNCRKRRGGSALVEFALAWPLVLVLVLGAVQLGVWAGEAHAVRTAALAGAESASTSGGSEETAQQVALSVLRPSLVGVDAAAWCPEAGTAPPAPVWVCASGSEGEVRVRVGGRVPSLVPIPLADGLPVAADIRLQREAFAR
jgi:hypothetical protein